MPAQEKRNRLTTDEPTRRRPDSDRRPAESHRTASESSGQPDRGTRPKPRSKSSQSVDPRPRLQKPGSENGGTSTQTPARISPAPAASGPQKASSPPRPSTSASARHLPVTPDLDDFEDLPERGRRPGPKGKIQRDRRPPESRRVPEAGKERLVPPKAPAAPPRPKEVVLPAAITVRELAEKMGISPIDVIKELMNNGIMANINQLIDFDTAAIVAGELGFTVLEEKPAEIVEQPKEPETPKTLRQIICETAAPEDLKPRPPIVTVLGHVDHGKTTLLDAIRKTSVVETEAGGITQRIGAYQVKVGDKQITFLDTPGHEAFTAMRARGAQVTDLAVLVVAADDGVMPQTREAINHARAAQVPILVALNKIDKPNANPERLKQQLADLGLVVEDWGGDVICVPVSAKYGQGIDELLENILLVTEVADLKANPNCSAVGTVVESRLDKTKGPIATLLVQNGTLHVGDALLVGHIAGRIRAMFNDKGETVTEAGPSTPVAVLGLPDVPTPGDIFEVMSSEREARAKAAERMEAERAAAGRPAARVLSLEDMARRIQAGQEKELNIILKADAQGSIEPIVKSLGQLGDENLRVKILHSATGNISESDVMLAAASKAIVVGFAVQPDNAALRLAEQEGVDIRLYDIIYMLLEDIEKALRGLEEPEYREVITAHAEVRAVFTISKIGKVAGCYVTDGTVTRDAHVRVRRRDVVLFEGRLHSLKRFQEDVREVAAGYECGIAIEGFNDFVEGDILEFYRKEIVR